MPKYTLVANVGTVKTTIDVIAFNAEAAERLIKKEIARLFRHFPSGSLVGPPIFIDFHIEEAFGVGVINPEAAAQVLELVHPITNFQQLYDPATGLSSSGSAQTTRPPLHNVAGGNLHIMSDRYLEFKNTINGLMRPHVYGFTGLVVGQQITVTGCIRILDGVYTVLNTEGELRLNSQNWR